MSGINLDPNAFHDSMKNHPQPLPPMICIFHETDAPIGKNFPLEEGEEMLRHRNGWLDTPAKFARNKASSTQDSGGDDAIRDAIVAKAVRVENELQASKDEELRPEWGSGAYDGPITETDEQLEAVTSIDSMVQFLRHYKLIEKVDSRAKLPSLLKKAKSLRDEHNKLIG